MKPLRDSFRKNGLPYTLIKRNEKIALFGVCGCHTNEFIHFEVCRIHIVNNEFIGHREVIIGNEQFGKEGSLAFNSQDEALNYYGELSKQLNVSDKTLRQGVDTTEGSKSLYGAITEK